eukprot:scaffold15373_cov115-Isochrysis_galbana.AAC.1
MHCDPRGQRVDAPPSRPGAIALGAAPASRLTPGALHHEASAGLPERAQGPVCCREAKPARSEQFARPATGMLCAELQPRMGASAM